MLDYKVDFESLAWESPLPGMRQKAFEQGQKRVRYVEYTQDLQPHWCNRGHYGYILAGRFELEFETGKQVFEAGDGVFIPAGEEHRHRGVVLTRTVSVIFVEDV
jgi:quercetin dioxygenase-like cupin family protein